LDRPALLHLLVRQSPRLMLLEAMNCDLLLIEVSSRCILYLIKTNRFHAYGFRFYKVENIQIILTLDGWVRNRVDDGLIP
jgi:hypothetical protein